jgi:short-subunit dehydrogenase
MTTALADECAGHGVEVTAVLPTFTNTELLAGTSPTAAQRPIQAEDVAAAVVKVLDNPKTIVSVAQRGEVLRRVDAVAADTPPALAQQENWQ